jgi:hypothetical protein
VAEVSGTVTVTGGSGSIVAEPDDLLALAQVFGLAAAALDDIRDELGYRLLRMKFDTDHDVDRCGHDAIVAELDQLVSGAGPLAQGQRELADLGTLLRLAAFDYLEIDGAHGFFSSIASSISHLVADAGQVGADAAAATGNVVLGRFGRAGADLRDAAPPVTDLVSAGLAGPERALALLPDGHAVLHDLGPDVRAPATAAPHDLADLIGELTLRNAGRHGEISVSFVVGADGRRRAIVDIPGTKSWNPAPNHDVTSVSTDIRAMAGLDTSYEDGIFDALHAAGVRPDEDVMLVGHSEGGIVAVNAARDAVRTGRFRVTHVVTAGSPIGKIALQLPENVEVLALENSADVVPAADGAANPARLNITTVTVADQHGSVGANHSLDQTYQPEAVAADHSRNAAINGFVYSASDFLDAAPGQPMATSTYQITRGW